MANFELSIWHFYGMVWL